MGRTEQFRVSVKAFDVDSKVWTTLIHIIEDSLNTQLNIKKYGADLNAILIIYVAHGMNERIHPNFIIHSRNRKELVLQYRLNNDAISVQNEIKTFQVVAHAYLDAMKQAQKQKRIKDFDFAAFREDARKVFETKGWLLKEAA